MNYHFDAGDSSLIKSDVSKVEGCVASFQEWMDLKSLKLNPSKTELLLITSKTIYTKLVCPTISICDTLIEYSEVVKTIGILLDKHIAMERHVTSVCKAVPYNLYTIAKIRRFLSQSSTEKLVHAFVTSNPDYCSALFCGLPSSLIRRMQRIQNILLPGSLQDQNL